MTDKHLSLFNEGDFNGNFLCDGFEDKALVFVRLFRAVWVQIPVADRETIIRFFGVHQIPFLVWLQGKENYPQKQGPAKYDNIKNMMIFDAARLFRFPFEKWIALAIAHEFCHVYLFAVDDPTHTAPKPKDRQAFLDWDYQREEAVKHLLSRWKFDLAEYERFEKWGKGSDWGCSSDWLRETDAK